MSGAPAVSVIALFDRGEFEPCLSSLLKQKDVDFEVVAVVSDENAAKNACKDDRVHVLVISDRNPSLRRNRAAEAARGKYLAFIDDDAVAPDDWLKKGIDFLERLPEVAGVGGPNLCPENPGFRGLVTEIVLTAPVIGAGSRAYRGGGEIGEAKAGEIHLVNFMVRREWFERVQGFNEALGYGGEDTEFLYVAKEAGGRFTFDPGLVVRHQRRPFGPAYFSQRFHLRKQSARLFVAYPDIYSGSLSFWAALLLVPALVGIFAVPLFSFAQKAGVLSVAYIFLTAWAISGVYFGRPGSGKKAKFGIALLLMTLAVFPAHHLANLAGLWWGLLVSLLQGPWRVRKRLKRDPG